MSRAAVGILLFVLAAAPASASEKKSVYTDLDLGACRGEPADPDDPLASGVWWCKGYGGMPVRVAEGDLRFLVSYGEHAIDELAAEQTLPAFNTIGEKLEWRLEKSGDGTWAPFATILRYFTDSGEGAGKGQFLVVTKLGGRGAICQVAVIDALLNKDANALARQTADEAVPGFRCGVDELIHPGLNRD